MPTVIQNLGQSNNLHIHHVIKMFVLLKWLIHDKRRLLQCTPSVENLFEHLQGHNECLSYVTVILMEK